MTETAHTAILPPPRVLIAAAQGHSGKTTFSLGLCAALAERGLAVQAFKKGPDYIDPSWLSEAAARPCRSLDGFFMPSAAALRHAFLKGVAARPDVAIIEGNHGLYDSTEPDGWGSGAHMARLLHTPVLLVVNASRMGRSAAALVLGFQHFEPETPIAGVILNQVAQSRHEGRLRAAIEQTCGLPVLGALPRDERLTIPDRHLGLVPRGEDERLAPAIAACRSAVQNSVDVDAVLALARQAPAWPQDWLAEAGAPRHTPAPPATCTIGVLRDQAFSFYYPENLEALQEAGAQLRFVNALHDPALPALDGLYIGGGFPEMFLEPLSANHSLRQELLRAIQAGLPVYAECGGLMYLCRSIDYNGQRAEMVGALPFDISMTARPQGHGYVQLICDAANPFFAPGSELRGHEFHHSRLVNLDPAWPSAFQVPRGQALGNRRDGLVTHNVLAGYTHIHALAAPAWAPGFVARCANLI